MKYDPLEAELTRTLGPELPLYEQHLAPASLMAPKKSLLGFDVCPGMPVADFVFWVVIGMSVIGWCLNARLMDRARSRPDFIKTSLVLTLIPFLLGCFAAIWKYEQLLPGDIFQHGELASIYYCDAVSGGLWMVVQNLLWSIPNWLLFARGILTFEWRASANKATTAVSTVGGIVRNQP